MIYLSLSKDDTQESQLFMSNACKTSFCQAIDLEASARNTAVSEARSDPDPGPRALLLHPQRQDRPAAFYHISRPLTYEVHKPSFSPPQTTIPQSTIHYPLSTIHPRFLYIFMILYSSDVYVTSLDRRRESVTITSKCVRVSPHPRHPLSCRDT